MLELLRPRSALALARLAALTAPLILAACDHPADPAGSPDRIAFSKQIDLPTTQTILAAGPTRVKIDVIPGSLTAAPSISARASCSTLARVTGVRHQRTDGRS